MSENILKLFIEKGFLLDKDMLNFFNDLKDESIANEIINKIAVVSQKKLITKSLVGENIHKIKPLIHQLDEDKKKLVEKYFIDVSISVEVKKESEIVGVDESVGDDFSDGRKISSNDLEEGGFCVGVTNENSEGVLEKGNVKILSSPIIAAQKLTVRDFVKHLRSRYNFMKSLLQQRVELEGLTAIDKISGNTRNFSIIGIITHKQVTKNKNLILEVEDLTGKTKLLINQGKEDLFEKSKEILLDDVIGFNVSGTRDFLYVNDLFYPDCFAKEKNKTNDEVYALFTSDFHVGSGNFLEKNLNKFVNWLNGVGCNDEEKEMLRKIKYLFVVGDSIDGVGIYPGQEKDLIIKDIKKQYEKLSEFYEKIPKHISIIQCAGQHDAVRVAEPQPPIGEDFGEPLCKFDNLYLVSNPSFVEIEGSENKKGISVLMYHGASMHGVINEIEELRLCNAHSTPAKVVKHLLFRRHLAPSHGATTYIPNKDEDSMIIKEVPDIITTGDLHKTDIDNYNGVLIISNSCWQSMTAFEEKVGNQPDPCKVPILNLQTRAIKILDFSGDGDEILVGGRNERNKNDNLEKVDEKEGVGSGADENNNDIEGVNGVGCVKVEKECTVTSVGVGEESHEEMVCEIKNENSLKIGIDIDEVIVEYLDKFLEFYNPKFDKSFSKKDFKTYYFEDTIGGSHDNAVELVKEMGCDCDFKLVDGSKEGVKHILDNHNVFAITSRHSIFKNSTFNFLKGHFGDRFEDILFTGEAFQESGITKADLCAELGINVIIEDNIIFAKECIEKGVKVILLDKPWNQDNFEHGNFFRVNNWEGVLERIKEIRGVKNG